MYPGKFIAFEGLDGAGKTTQAELLCRWLSANLKDVRIVFTREPSDGIVGSQIRLALNHILELGEKPLGALFAADRSDHLARTIIPALERGDLVVCDRYYLSSFAFQSLFLEFDFIRALNEGALRPDLIIFLSISPEIGKKRLEGSRGTVERYETPEILQKVAGAYASLLPKLKEENEPIIEIDGTGSIDGIHREIVEAVKTLIPQLGPS